MDLQTVMNKLQALGTEQTKKTYINHGAHEPLFGVTIGAMKPLMKKTGKNYDLSMALYATGNYDASYFAGMISICLLVGAVIVFSLVPTQTIHLIGINCKQCSIGLGGTFTPSPTVPDTL